MKKIVLVVVMGLFCISLTIALAKSYVRGDTMDAISVQKKWGETPLNAQDFKGGSIEIRAKMASSVLKNKHKFVGLRRGEIRKSLGDYSGFYISGMYPTYLIQEARSKAEEAWQLVFLIDTNERVKDVVVQKNCCYK